MPYNFPDELQREIDAFADDNAGRVDQEIRIVRWLIQKAVTDGKHHLANSLLATLAKLSTTEIANQVRSGQLLGTDTILRIARRASAVGRRLDGLPNQEALSDAPVGRLQTNHPNRTSVVDPRPQGFRRRQCQFVYLIVTTVSLMFSAMASNAGFHGPTYFPYCKRSMLTRRNFHSWNCDCGIPASMNSTETYNCSWWTPTDIGRNGSFLCFIAGRKVKGPLTGLKVAFEAATHHYVPARRIRELLKEDGYTIDERDRITNRRNQ